MLSTFHYPRACSYPAEPGIGTVGPSWLVMALMRQPSRCPHSNKTLQDLLKHSRCYSIKVSHHGKREYQKSQINLTSQSPLHLHWFIHPCNISNRPRHEERSKIQDDDVPLRLCFPSACQGRVAGENLWLTVTGDAQSLSRSLGGTIEGYQVFFLPFSCWPSMSLVSQSHVCHYFRVEVVVPPKKGRFLVQAS